MKIALIAPPFIAIPPPNYGGTELFITDLARGLRQAGIDVNVYTNGESRIEVERPWLYEDSQWPIKNQEHAWMRELNHTSWAAREAAQHCDVIHLQSSLGLAFSRFITKPFILTLHGPHEPQISQVYSFFPNIDYVCISHAQCAQESMPRRRVIHHGVDLQQYRVIEKKQRYLSFIGRIAPIKGTHIAIDVAKRTGIPLKIAGDIQPANRDYFEKKIKPDIDGQLVEYIGLADLATKNELLGNSLAMLFPIQWNEPFGLVMVEAMACGTPVLAMPGGSVPEVVRDGVSGYICRSVAQMAKRARNLNLDATAIRGYAEENFSISRMTREYISVYEQALRQFETGEPERKTA